MKTKILFETTIAGLKLFQCLSHFLMLATSNYNSALMTLALLALFHHSTYVSEKGDTAATAYSLETRRERPNLGSLRKVVEPLRKECAIYLCSGLGVDLHFI